MHDFLSEQEQHQERMFDEKAGKTKIYHIGGRDNRNHAIKINRILQALQLRQNDTVLEVGTGEGEHAFKLLKYTDANYTGVDISQKSLDVAHSHLKQFRGRYVLQKDNANALSFNDNSFDAVFCAATLHHMENPYLMISEMARVLKHGGRLAIMEPNWIYPTNIGFMLLLKEDRNMWLMRRTNFIKWLTKAGMKKVKAEHLLYTPPSPKFLAPFYDIIDKVCIKFPVVSRCSLMLFGTAEK